MLVHPNPDPVAFSIGPVDIHWYGLMYLVGFGAAYLLGSLRARQPGSGWTAEMVSDFVFWGAMGAVLGGRFGYVLFYNFDQFLADPLWLFAVWEGGMSFHGGLLGVTIAILIIAKQRGIKLMPIADIAGVVTPIGLFLGRCANFINAELYGRPTDAPIGMVFPEGRAGGTPSAYNWQTHEWVYTGNEVARHPSQLYEATLEGLVPAIIISILVWRFGLLKRPGLAAGLFLLFYGVGRSISEQFREPDSFTWGVMPDWLTMGQLLSLPMWIGGAFLVWNALRKPPVQVSA